jgi:RNA polymerase sigma factor (sigma-70 family)
MNIIDSDIINDDALLLRELQHGSEKAFKILYQKYWAQAYSSAYKRLQDADQAKDVVQDIFTNIWLNRENRIENLLSYLRVSVRNQVFKLVNKQKSNCPFVDMFNNIPALNENADSNIQYQEFYKAYEALLTALPSKMQVIFRLRYHDDLTTKAIAAHLGISRKTVQNQLGKAVDQLRVNLLPSLVLISLFLDK